MISVPTHTATILGTGAYATLVPYDGFAGYKAIGVWFPEGDHRDVDAPVFLDDSGWPYIVDLSGNHFHLGIIKPIRKSKKPQEDDQ